MADISSNTKTKFKPKVRQVNYDYLSEFQQDLQTRLPKPLLVVFLLTIISVIPGIVNNGFNPAIKAVAIDFHSTITAIQNLASYYFFGLGFGQLFWGPISDRFGRKKTLVVSAIFSIITNALFIVATSYNQLIFIRFFQGFCFAFMALLPTVMVKDSYSPRQFIILNSWLVIFFMFAPALSPIIGGYITVYLSWHWIFILVIILTLLSLSIYLSLVPESLDPAKRQHLHPVKVIRNYYTIFTNPRSIFCLLICGFVSLLIFNWVTMSAAILIGDWKVPSENYGYYGLLPIFAVFVTNKLNGTLAKTYNPQKILVYSTIVQLVSMIICSIIAYKFLGPIGIVICQVCFAGFSGFQNGNIMSIYLMDYAHLAGTATSLFVFFRVVVPASFLIVISAVPRYNGETFIISNIIITVLLAITVILFNYLWPSEHKAND